MLDSIASLFRSFVMLATLALVVFVGWKGYQTYKYFEAKFTRIDRYLSKADDILGQHDRVIHRIESTIKKWKISDRTIVPVDGVPHVVRERCKNDACSCNDAFSLDPCNCDPCKCGPKQVSPPIPIEDTYSKPTVILYSIEGCGPCEQWWREQSPRWLALGWKLERRTSTNNRPTPYWDVYDGKKWMRFDGSLTYERYKAAGGR